MSKLPGTALFYCTTFTGYIVYRPSYKEFLIDMALICSWVCRWCSLLYLASRCGFLLFEALNIKYDWFYRVVLFNNLFICVCFNIPVTLLLLLLFVNIVEFGLVTFISNGSVWLIWLLSDNFVSLSSSFFSVYYLDVSLWVLSIHFYNSPSSYFWLVFFFKSDFLVGYPSSLLEKWTYLLGSIFLFLSSMLLIICWTRPFFDTFSFWEAKSDYHIL